MKKKIGAAVVAMTLAATLSSCSGVETSGGETLTFATVAGWDDTEAVTALWSVLLEDRGYQVDTMAVDLAAGISGIARGDVDGYLNTWLPDTHADYVDEYKDDLVILDQPFYENNRAVLVVPEFVEENSIRDLIDNADEYDDRIIGLEAGAGNMRQLGELLESYGASETLDVVEGSTPAALAELQNAVKEKKHTAILLWQPHWIFANDDVKVLEDTENGWAAPDSSHIVLSKEFSEKHKDIQDWMSRSKLDDKQYSTLMSDVSNADDSEAGARKWLEDPANNEAVQAWFY